MRLRLKLIGILFILGSFSTLSLITPEEIQASKLFLLDTLVAVLGVSIVLLAPRISRYPVLLAEGIGIGLFIVFRLALAISNIFEFSASFSISLIEIIFLLVVVKLAYDCSKEIRLLESGDRSLMRAVDFPQRLDSIEGQRFVKREMLRSRQYERPLTTILFDIKSIPPISQVGKNSIDLSAGVLAAYTKFLVAQTIHQHLQLMDALFVTETNDYFVIICPETAARDAARFADGLGQALKAEFGFKPVFAAATFPVDGLTFNKIFEQARQKINQAREESFSSEPSANFPAFSE